MQNQNKAPIIDPRLAPDAVYLIDTFKVPAEARAQFEEAMKRNRDFIRAIDGFRGDTVLVRKQGDGFDIATIAAWENADAIARARELVAAHYQRIGFDMQKTMAGWGVTLQRTFCTAPTELQ